ncbi:DUF4232 domain-containing protein [Streptomyces sp. NPDC057939]|uniref:DUF4232 domain-containing protein n=1 Tax=Streptomyces sp. NPDC057939 TaxID=3346284 RepID=UPI0036E9D22F
MRYTAAVRRGTVVLAAAAAATALVTGCTPTGEDGSVASPSSPPAASGPAKPTGSATPTGPGSGGTTSGGTTSGGTASGGGASGGGGKEKPSPSGSAPATGAKTCASGGVKVSEGHQADVRPPGTGTGAAVLSVTNTSSQPCVLTGFPTVAGAGNGSPDKNRPLVVTRSGTAGPVTLAPGGRAWTKLTFVQVQGEADGYCVSGATPSSFPTLVIGVPGAGAHQIAMDDGVFAECDDKVTVTAFSATKPS